MQVKLQVEVTVTGRLIPRHDIKTFAYHIILFIYYMIIIISVESLVDRSFFVSVDCMASV